MLLFFCGSRRAIRGSLRSYLRGFAAWYGAQSAPPLLSLSHSPPPFSREGVGGWVYVLYIYFIKVIQTLSPTLSLRKGKGGATFFYMRVGGGITHLNNLSDEVY